jgi:hypothetical protein
MSYLHYKVRVGPAKSIQVKLTGNANVRLLDAVNYFKYRAGKPYQSSGGAAQQAVVNLQPPHPGEWHVIVDLKGQDSECRAFVQVLDEKSTGGAGDEQAH